MERRRVVVGPGEVRDAVVDGGVGVAGAFGAELPDRPVGAVGGIEEGDERGERIAVNEGGVGGAGARGYDD